MGFPDSSVGKESACSAGDPGSIPGSGRSPGERIGSVQFSRSVVSDFFATPWTAACQASLSITNSWSVLKFWVPIPVFLGFSCGSARKESTCNVGDLGSIPGLGRSLGEGKGYPLQYSGLENSMDCIVHGVTKSRTRLTDFQFHFDAIYHTFCF